MSGKVKPTTVTEWAEWTAENVNGWQKTRFGWWVDSHGEHQRQADGPFAWSPYTDDRDARVLLEAWCGDGQEMKHYIAHRHVNRQHTVKVCQGHEVLAQPSGDAFCPVACEAVWQAVEGQRE